jgi:hypothetical protein
LIVNVERNADSAICVGGGGGRESGRRDLSARYWMACVVDDKRQTAAATDYQRHTE